MRTHDHFADFRASLLKMFRSLLSLLNIVCSSLPCTLRVSNLNISYYMQYCFLSFSINRSDGSFEVHDVPTGSYIVEFAHPKYMFEATRIDISARGKIRARRVNNVDSKSVVQVAYPLKVRSKGLAGYFQKREEFKIVDVLKNPMVS